MEIKTQIFVPCPKMDKHLVSFSDCLMCNWNIESDVLRGIIGCNYEK